MLTSSGVVRYVSQRLGIGLGVYAVANWRGEKERSNSEDD